MISNWHQSGQVIIFILFLFQAPPLTKITTFMGIELAELD